MLQQYRRLLPFLLAGLLLFNLAKAIADSTRGNWISVGVMALALAIILWRRARTAGQDDPPHDDGSP
ncbi:MAG: hypothetical protein M3432_07170 [Chloroflexota bacterium]|nr:hypothetical protein [Chloroflexota bacterium]